MMCVKKILRTIYQTPDWNGSQNSTLNLTLTARRRTAPHPWPIRLSRLARHRPEFLQSAAASGLGRKPINGIGVACEI
jgi:hypothetical protein